MMSITVLPLFVCSCGLKLYTWEAAAQAHRIGCTKCEAGKPREK